MTISNDPNLQMQQMAQYAVLTAEKKFGSHLDFAEGNLRQFEMLLEKAHLTYQQSVDEGTFSSVALEKTVLVWGSYLGEVIRRNWEGIWISGQGHFFIQIGHLTFDPLKQVQLRIVCGEQYSLTRYYQEVKSDIRNGSTLQSNLLRQTPPIPDKGIDRSAANHPPAESREITKPVVPHSHRATANPEQGHLGDREEYDFSFWAVFKRALGNLIAGPVAGIYAGAAWFIADLILIFLGNMFANGVSIGGVIVAIIALIILIMMFAFLGPLLVFCGIIAGIVGGFFGALAGLAMGVTSFVIYILLSYSQGMRAIRNILIVISNIGISIFTIAYSLENYMNIMSDPNFTWLVVVNYIMAGIFGLVIGLAFLSDKKEVMEKVEAEEPDTKKSYSIWRVYGKLARGILGASEIGEQVRKKERERASYESISRR